MPALKGWHLSWRAGERVSLGAIFTALKDSGEMGARVTAYFFSFYFHNCAGLFASGCCFGSLELILELWA